MSQVATIDRSRPDFRHVEAWVFDLDHTLYRIDSAAAKEVEDRICGFVQRFLGLPRDEAYRVQKNYLREYGITLAGLMKHHGVDPDVYHAEINDIDALALGPDHALRNALECLPGQRIVFTNNCGNFAREVLSRLSLDDLFHEIVDIRALGYVPKPGQGAYERLMSRLLCAPEHAALFDDRACNLVPARALGMTTVWLSHGTKTPEDEHSIQFESANLGAFLRTVRT